MPAAAHVLHEITRAGSSRNGGRHYPGIGGRLRQESTRNYPAGQFGGLGGDVASKKQLDVNFARNDITSKCPVWKSIQKTLMAEGGIERKRKFRLTDNDRVALVLNILNEGGSGCLLLKGNYELAAANSLLIKEE